MAALGSLVVKLALDYAQYTSGLSKSEQDSLAFAKRVQDQVDQLKVRVGTSIGNVAGIIAAGLSINAFKGLLDGAIEGAAALEDLAASAGTTVEALSGLSSVGKFSDMGAEGIAASMNKLTKNLTSVTEESAGTGKAIRAIGLDVDAFKALKPEDQMMAVAKSLDTFQDGAGKSAVMMALFGKEGAKMIPFMKDLADVGELQAKVTTEQSAAAAAYDDNLTRITASTNAWQKELVMGMIPALDTAAQAYLDVMNGTGGLRDEVRQLSKDGSIAEWTRSAIKGVTYVMDVFSGLKAVVKSLGSYWGALAATAMESVTSLGAAASKALKGDFSGAADELSGVAGRVSNIWSSLGNDLGDIWGEQTLGSKLRARIDELSTAGKTAVAAKKHLNVTDLGVSDKSGKEKIDPTIKAYADLTASIREKISAQGLELSIGGKLTEAQKVALDVQKLVEKGTISLTQAQSEELQALVNLLAVMDQETEANAKHFKQLEALATAREREVSAANSETAGLQQQLKAQTEANEALGLSVTALAALEAARLSDAAAAKERLAAVVEEEEGNVTLADQYREQARLLRDLASVRTGGARAREQLDMWASVESTAKGVWTSVANDGVSAFERIGKTLKASLLDVLWQMTGRQWLISVGTAVGLPGAAMAGQQSTGASAGFGGLRAVSSLKTLYDSMTTGVSGAVSAGFESLVTSSVGEKMGLSYYNGTGYETTGMGQTLGQYAGVAGNALAGYGLQKAISGGYKTGESGLVDAITVAASAYFGPVAGAVAGVFNRAFGRKFTGSGVEGEFGGAAGFSGNAYADYKGGWLRSDKTTRGALDPALAAGLADGYELLQTSVGDMSKALGLSAKGLDTYTRKIRFSTNGLSQDQVAAKLQEEFGLLGDEMAQLVLGTYAYTKAGEGSAAALARLSSSLVGVNATFDVLGRTLYSADLIGADMASQLADAFGGLANVASASQAYFAAYYSDAERAAAGTRLLTAQFGELGLTFPASEAGFRALVDGLDLTTESGRTTYAELLKLAPEYKTLSELQKTIAAEQLRIAQENGKKVAEALLHSFTGGGAIVPALGSVGQAINTVAGQSGTLQGSLDGTRHWLAVVGSEAGALQGSLDGARHWLAVVGNEAGTLQGSLDGTRHWLAVVGNQAGMLQGSLDGTRHWLAVVGDQAGTLQGSLDGTHHWLWTVAGQSDGLQGSLAGVNHWTWTVAKQSDVLAGRYAATADIQGDLALATGALFAQFGLGEVSATDLAKATFTFGTDADNTARAADFAAVQLAGMAVQLGGVNAASAGFAGQVHTITRVLGDASSGTLYFGDRLVTMTGQLTPAQQAVGGLQAEIANLRLSAGVVNMSGLIAQMDSLYRAAGGFADQEFAATFINTISGVFETIGGRVKDTLGQIATERAAVREAAISIINPTAKTSAQITAELSGVRVAGIDNSGLLSAQSELAKYVNHVTGWTAESARLEQEKATAKQRSDELYAEAGRVKAEVDARANSYNYSFEANARYGEQQEFATNTAGVDLGVDGTRSRAETWYWHGAIESRPWEYNQVGEGGSSLVWNDYQKLNSAVDASNSMIASLGTLTSQYVNAVREVDAGKGAVAHWEAAAAKAALDYTAALQQYSVSSSKAVTQLGRLREETVAWYESQKQLADSMSSGAATLRQTVADYRFSQLDTASQARVLQEQFSLAYSMALSTSGETLVGYGQRLNDLINPLLQTAQDSGMDATAYAGLVSTVLARSEAVAARLDDLAPKNYQAESLGLLGSIDSVLASLEAGAKSADQLIVEALKASQEATRAGFQAVVAALTGNAIPAFASGGYYPGGLALVGERGPEFINFANPGQVYTADQTAQMLAGPAVQPWAGGFGGGMQAAFDRMAQQMASMVREIAALRAESRQVGVSIATNTGKLARQNERWDVEGVPMRNADGTTLAAEAV